MATTPQRIAAPRNAAASPRATGPGSRRLTAHARAFHSLDRGTPLSLVAGTLGHANVTTSGYQHPRPRASSGDTFTPPCGQSEAVAPSTCGASAHASLSMLVT